MTESNMEQGQKTACGNAEVHNLLVSARAAFDEGQFERGAEACSSAVEIDPENAQAWSLLACYGGWDHRQAEINVNLVLEAAKRAIKLTSEAKRSQEASDIYAERKKQISEELEAIMMMPSYMGAKKLHAFMQDWLRLLKNFPELSPVVIEGEVTLIGNICQRSKLAVMPNDRLVYTAYATFNNKEPYGETFKRELAQRIDVERARKEHELLAAQERAELHLQNAGNLSADAVRSQLEADALALQEARESVEGLSGKAGYEQELQQLQQQKANMKPFKVFKRRELEERIAELTQRLEELEKENGQTIASFDAVLAKVNKKIGELKA